jgi:hypothetical protein
MKRLHNRFTVGQARRLALSGISGAERPPAARILWPWTAFSLMLPKEKEKGNML